MQKVIQALMNSKAAQKFAVALAAVLLLVYFLNKMGWVPFRTSILIVVTILIVLLAYQVFLKGIGKRKASAFEKGLADDADVSGGGKVAARAAQKELADRWKSSVKELKRAGLSIYDLPWYMLIGEPQSGKSTTLRKSGLEFPVGTEALSGAGGTRNCDWWFTDHGVILDTAGRFAFQEKNAPDAAEWTTFLKLLARHRADCPINGVLLVIPCTSLLGDSPEQRLEKAQNIRERLTDIQRELEIQFPVYTLITKCDQILGFTEFFSRLPAAEQLQLVGYSTHGPFIQAYDPEKTRENFDSVLSRIQMLRLRLLEKDLDLQEIDKLFVFPEELQSIREPLKEYLDTIFMKNRYLPPPFFRGFYFTSGMQEGTPLAKAVLAMLRSAGEGASEIIKRPFSGEKAFFIGDFYREKVFKEENLIVMPSKRFRAGRRFALIAAGALSLILIVLSVVFGLRLYRLNQRVEVIRIASEEIKTQYDNTFLATPEYPPLSRALKASYDFTQKSSESDWYEESGREVQEAILNIHGLHFLRAVLHRQALLTYEEMKSAGPGASFGRDGGADPNAPIEQYYRQFARLWSLDEGAAPGEPGGADDADVESDSRLRWEALVIEDEEGGARTWAPVRPSDDENRSGFSERRFRDLPLEEAFRLLLERVNDDLGDEIPPAPDLRGDLLYQEVEAVRRQYDREFQPRRVEDLISSAERLRLEHDIGHEQLMDLPPITIDPTSKLFAELHLTIEQYREELERFAEELEENRVHLEAIPASAAGLAGMYRRRLPWYGSVHHGSQRGTDLAGHIERHSGEAYEALGARPDNLRERLETVADVFSYQSVDLSEAMKRYTEGLDKILALETALEGREENVRRLRDIERRVELWKQNEKARLELDQWAGAHGEDPNEKVRQLAQYVTDQVLVSADEMFEVKSYFWYVDAVVRYESLGEETIRQARLTDPPRGLARGATAREMIVNVEERVGELEAYQADKDFQCEGCKNRLQERIAELGAGVIGLDGNFRDYWQKAYENWEPFDEVAGIGDWADFKDQRLFRGENLVTKIHEIDSNLFPSIEAYYGEEGRSSVRPFEIYEQWKRAFDSRLDRRLRDFSESVRLMDDQPALAFRQLKADSLIANRTTLEDDLGAVISRDFDPNVTEKLSFVTRRVETLIDPSRLFDQNLRNLLARWEEKLAARFPFTIEPWGGADAEITEIDLGQVGAQELADFLNEYEASIAGEEERIYEKWKLSTLRDDDLIEFLERCSGLRRYFLEAEAESYQSTTVTATLKSLSDRAVELFNEVKFSSQDRDLMTRGWRTRTDLNKSIEFDWVAREDGRPFEANARHDDGDPNLVLKFPGDFSLLAYLYSHEPDDRDSELQIFRNVPFVFFLGDENYRIVFDFEFDRTIPALPDWSKVEDWLKN